MNQEFFTNLPSEIIIDILARLPVRTIICCKCVCKSWLDLIETHEFAKSHLPKSVQGLAIFQSRMQSASFKMFEFEDGRDLEQHELHYDLVTEFGFPHASEIEGSSNGLLFLRDGLRHNGFYVCNPITRNYVKLHCSQEFVCSFPQVVTYGFGASKVTGQHKVVRISHHLRHYQETLCQVYTLGTGSWRRIATAGAPLVHYSRTMGAFLNGNLHWLVFDSNDRPCISCFDLETELSNILSSPPLPGSKGFCLGLSALKDCLCVCDNTSDGEIAVWLMEEYGVEKSWTKEFVISKVPDFAGECIAVVYPIKVFEDGDVLMAWGHFFLFYYSKRNKNIQKIGMFKEHTYIHAILHTPSFFSPKFFGMEENVMSF